RVLCGSAWDEQNYPLLMNDRCASAVLTHVPAGAGDDAELLTKLFSELAEHSAPPALQFVFTDQRFIRSLAAVEGAGLKLIDICVAVKPYPNIGAVYQSQYDLILVFGNTNAETQSKPQIHRSNVWFYPR